MAFAFAREITSEVGAWMLKQFMKSVFILTIFLGQSLAEERPLVIRFSTQAPSDAEYFQSMLHFKQRVEAESNEKIRIDLSDSGKLYDSDKIAAAVSSGKVEIGMLNLTRLVRLFLLPMLSLCHSCLVISLLKLLPVRPIAKSDT